MKARTKWTSDIDGPFPDWKRRERRTLRRRFKSVVWANTILLAALSLAGCGGAPTIGRHLVLTASEALVAVDAATADEYTAAANRALAAAASMPEYRRAMEPWDALEAALRTARSSLLSADAALDAWDQGGSERWLPAAGCVASSLALLAQAIAAAGVEVPPELGEALAIAADIGAPVCAMGGS